MAEELDRAERRLSAILSADAVGYSRLMCEDQEGTICAINEARQIIADSVERFRGRVVDSPGDNVLAEFASIVDALDSAIEIQTRIMAANADVPPDRKMHFRIGLNLGEVVVEGERIYGSGVNIAARLEGISQESGICISGSAYDQIGNRPDLAFEYLGKKKVKNIKEPVRCYRVLWEEEDLKRLAKGGRTVRRLGRTRLAAAGPGPGPSGRRRAGLAVP